MFSRHKHDSAMRTATDHLDAAAKALVQRRSPVCDGGVPSVSAVAVAAHARCACCVTLSVRVVGRVRLWNDGGREGDANAHPRPLPAAVIYPDRQRRQRRRQRRLAQLRAVYGAAHAPAAFARESPGPT
jgi:hypothetical protein